MRDPLTWSFPLGRLFGVVIRVHVLFPLVALAVVLRVAVQKDAPSGLWLEAALLMVLLFFAVLLHEFGHCFGARWVDGDAHDILLWPLGGLAAIDVPHTPRSHLIAAAAGPAVNLALALVTFLGLAASSMTPTFNPWQDPFRPVLHNWSDRQDYGTSKFGGGSFVFYGYKDAQGEWIDAKGVQESKKEAHREKIPSNDDVEVDEKKSEYYLKSPHVRVEAEQPYHMAPWQALAAKFFYVNWVLFLLNLLPGFPLDGGRMLQCLLWTRSDFREATLKAIFCGFLLMIVIAVYALVINEMLPFLLALFIWYTCRSQWILLETGGEESVFGYDFSQGYTSLEREASAPRRRRPNFFQRWKQRRAQLRMQREQETREAEERRMDELLEKVQREGLQSLTDEERRFLTRVSNRYRNRS
jgi:Zn-dependent protease